MSTLAVLPLCAGLGPSEGAARNEVNHSARDEVNLVSLSCAPPLREIALHLLTNTHLRVAGSELSPQAEEQRGTMRTNTTEGQRAPAQSCISAAGGV